MIGSQLVASDAAKITMGGFGASFVVIAILVSTLGANNGIVLTAARIPYAMARAGVFFPSQGVVHSRYGTPTIALITQGVIASVLTALGRYDQLFTYVVFAQFVFYALSAGAGIRLRSTEPEVPRPYRTWGYPLTPLVFIAFALWLVFNTIRETPVDSAVGAGIILVGLPGYFYWKKRREGTVGASTVLYRLLPYPTPLLSTVSNSSSPPATVEFADPTHRASGLARSAAECRERLRGRLAPWRPLDRPSRSARRRNAGRSPDSRRRLCRRCRPCRHYHPRPYSPLEADV